MPAPPAPGRALPRVPSAAVQLAADTHEQIKHARSGDVLSFVYAGGASDPGGRREVAMAAKHPRLLHGSVLSGGFMVERRYLYTSISDVYNLGDIDLADARVAASTAIAAGTRAPLGREAEAAEQQAANAAAEQLAQQLAQHGLFNLGDVDFAGLSAGVAGGGRLPIDRPARSRGAHSGGGASSSADPGSAGGDVGEGGGARVGSPANDAGEGGEARASDATATTDGAQAPTPEVEPTRGVQIPAALARPVGIRPVASALQPTADPAPSARRAQQPAAGRTLMRAAETVGDMARLMQDERRSISKVCAPLADSRLGGNLILGRRAQIPAAVQTASAIGADGMAAIARSNDERRGYFDSPLQDTRPFAADTGPEAELFNDTISAQVRRGLQIPDYVELVKVFKAAKDATQPGIFEKSFVHLETFYRQVPPPPPFAALPSHPPTSRYCYVH